MSKQRPPQLLVTLKNGDKYRLIVMKVVDTDPDKPSVNGYEFPRSLDVLDANEVAEIQGEDRFITAFVPVSVFGFPPIIGDKK